MTAYDNTNKGVLFDNDRKQTDKHPDMNGTLNINGVDHWFSGWWKTGVKGEFLSLSIGNPKDQQGQQSTQQAPAAATVRRGNRPSNQAPARAPAPAGNGFDDLDSDVPF